MRSRKRIAFALLGAAATLAIVATPYRPMLDGFSPRLVPETAAAKGGQKGDGGASGKGGGSRKGDSGKGGGDSSGQEGAPGQTSGPKDAGKQSRTSSKQPLNLATGDRIKVDGPNIEVMHPDGMKEEIAKDRYAMTDAKGRTIINRRVTASDRARLRAMIGR